MDGRLIVELDTDIALGSLEENLSALGAVLCPDGEDGHQGIEDDEKAVHRLLLKERCYPQDNDGTDDGCAKLSEDTAPLDVQQ